MTSSSSNFLGARALFNRLESEDKWIIIDTRFNFLQPQEGRKIYLKGHLPNAIYMPLEFDFSAEVTAHGGRHPLPEFTDFGKRLNQLGITPAHKVVVYDETRPENAARLWWMLKSWLGFEQVFILDGGMQSWMEENLPVSDKIPVRHATQSAFSENREPIADKTDILKMDPQSALVDCRSTERFLGQEELIDNLAGHIPGAINFCWESAFDSKGKLRPVDELQGCWSDLAHFEDVVCYCGSGVTACALIAAFEESGMLSPKLYVGGWSDWITWNDTPKTLGSGAI
jgi:thiosulfate/3-mercaptopyruvate sulfurtransferase